MSPATVHESSLLIWKRCDISRGANAKHVLEPVSIQNGIRPYSQTAISLLEIHYMATS